MIDDRMRQELRETIDELATQLLMAGASPGPGAVEAIRTCLEDIARRAREGGLIETAREASEVAGELASGSPCPEAVLSAGLQRLQESLAAARDPAREAPGLAQDPELLAAFVQESREHLGTIESHLLKLEQNPRDQEAVASVFRGFHTIKGLAGFMELAQVLAVAHEVETALDLVRKGELAISPAVIDVVLESADYLGQAVEAVEAALKDTRAVAEPDPGRLLARIRGLGEPAPVVEAAPAACPAPPNEATAPEAERASPAHGPLSLRVDTAKLDYLMDMVGEMVVAQSMVHHHAALRELADSGLQRDLARLARVTAEVRRTTLSLRMVPIGQLFQRVSRQVRDLARKAGKPVEIETSGDETTFDKNIAEELSAALVHMVRNSIDHGIEAAEVRRAAGKPEAGRIRLSARHQAGRIVVELADDGRGLDRDKILARAQVQGLIGESAQLSASEIDALIFRPGFSTADGVTGLSGRGVGMDVVVKQVEKLRGKVEVESTPGRGTVFVLRLPLTLAIIDGLVIAAGSERYIIPLAAVREFVRPAPEDLATVMGRGEMVKVRGKLLPLVRLHEVFGTEVRTKDPSQGLLVVAEVRGEPFCLMVDDLLGKQEVVIKGLGESLRSVRGIAAAAILGDGRVGLILDLEDLQASPGGRR